MSETAPDIRQIRLKLVHQFLIAMMLIRRRIYGGLLARPASLTRIHCNDGVNGWRPTGLIGVLSLSSIDR